MFNITLSSTSYRALKGTTKAMGIATAIEQSFTVDGTRYLDVAVGDQNSKYSSKLARLAERYQ